MSSPINKQQATTIAANAKYDIALSSLNFAPTEFSFLTPEALLLFCQKKLEGIDAQVKSAFQKQQSRNHLSGALSKLGESLSAKSENASGGVDANDTDLKKQITANFDAAIAAAGGNEGLVKRLVDQKAAFEASANGTNAKNDGAVAAWEMKKMADAVQSIQSDVNRQGELEMIQLQSLMSQRQQALQMCTNMVQSLGQSAMAIAQNVGK